MNEMIIPIPEKNYDFIRDYLNRNFMRLCGRTADN